MLEINKNRVYSNQQVMLRINTIMLEINAITLVINAIMLRINAIMLYRKQQESC